MVNTRAQLHVLVSHVQTLVSKLLIVDTEKELQDVGYDLQAAGLVCLGEQPLEDILTKMELARLELLKAKYKS
jgi:hypothetical protein